MTDYRESFKSLLENTFISRKGGDEYIVRETLSFLEKVLSFMPDKLFRYRSINEYTIPSFKKGTISLCKANCFSDKYDSMVFIDAEKQAEEMKEALKDGIKKVLKDVKENNPLLRTEKASQVCYLLEQGMTEKDVVDKVVKEQYSDFIEEIKRDLRQREWRFRDSERSARIACFTESIQSKYMWDTYADGYHGFALEYDLKEYLISCLNHDRPTYIFPVIYTDQRPDMTIDEANNSVFTKAQEEGWLHLLRPLLPFLDVNMLSPHKPYLYKDKEEYAHEKEWRMLYYSETNFDDYVEIPDDGCLKSIYYGMDITEEDYERLHKIALDKGIKEYKVSIDRHTPKYSLVINEL